MDQEHSELAEPTVYTFRQKVFRHEGNKNWGSFGRLRDYHVREFVFIGDDLMVRNQRNYVLEQVKQLVEELGLTARISVTSDPFVVPSMQKFKKIQVEEESKLELQLAYGPDNYLAVASFNLHGTTFTEPFDIRVKSTPHTVTGCVGFGLERWVLGFMAQHGTDPNEWKMITI
ncbi:Amino acid--[acyl-carrier-protein] ligase [compost metagenome]